MKKMERNELKVKTIIALIWLFIVALLSGSELFLVYRFGYIFPEKWYMIPEAWRGMELFDIYCYIMAQPWWQIVMAITLGLSLIIIPNMAYPVYCDLRSKK